MMSFGLDRRLLSVLNVLKHTGTFRGATIRLTHARGVIKYQIYIRMLLITTPYNETVCRVWPGGEAASIV